MRLKLVLLSQGGQSSFRSAASVAKTHPYGKQKGFLVLAPKLFEL